MKLLSIWNMELLTIGILAIFVVLMEIQSRSWRERGADTEVKIWRLKARSVQAAEGVVGALMKYKQLTSEVLLGKEHYYIGNRVYDDVYIKRWRIYERNTDVFTLEERLNSSHMILKN